MARRTAAEAAKTRDDILDAGRRLFTERGYAGASVPDVANAAGVTHGALYHHFENKHALFRAVFEEVERGLNERVLAAASRHDDIWDGFLAGTREVLVAMATPEFQQICLADAPAVFGAQEWHAVDSGIGYRTMRGGIELLHAAGYLRDADLEAVATLLFGGLTEACIQLARAGTTNGSRKPADDELTVDRVVDTTAAIILALSPGKP